MRCTLALLFGIICLTGCSTPEIKARTFYTSRKDLASYVIDTPDPEKRTIGQGQVIWVRWTCPQVDSAKFLNNSNGADTIFSGTDNNPAIRCGRSGVLFPLAAKLP